MKLLSAHISGLLGLIMIAATLLPSLHALGHDLSTNDNVQEAKVIPVTVDCDLCDFHFSSLDIPGYNNFDTFIPFKEFVHNLPVKANVYTLPQNLFSLRAPPAVIA
ncbi:hypothetical protein FHG64_09900 [Antarcticibacterium flavum]|uniref:DUF2946 domain-containing protein n=1 Tax=Antarcticibacterium flavum TaxID=2058175 RepID=A0A5B7X2G0_9FLAO|nr:MULTISPECIES: hypothetical protein [Antarcticibacterium]MCM4160133.1 hypothetical protein [Antarcticibacterium sp. W02-3]QCY69686.1 hypothetical protein FHG64_09900 [Antarcticibacterium flavum]